MPIKRVAIFSQHSLPVKTTTPCWVVVGRKDWTMTGAQLVKRRPSLCTTWRLEVNIMWIRRLSLQSCTTGPHCKLMTTMHDDGQWDRDRMATLWNIVLFSQNWFYNKILSLSIRRSSHEMPLARDVGAVAATGREGDRQGMRSIDLSAQFRCLGINVSFISIPRLIRFLSPTKGPRDCDWTTGLSEVNFIFHKQQIIYWL